MPYDNAYDSFFNDRAMGQVPAKGYNLNGPRYHFEWPMLTYDMNRLVGQQAPGALGDNYYTRDPGPSYTTGWTRPQFGTPAYDASPPTTVYSSGVVGKDAGLRLPASMVYAGDTAEDVAKTGAAPASVEGEAREKTMNMLPTLKMQHVVIIAAIAVIVTICIIK